MSQKDNFCNNVSYIVFLVAFLVATLNRGHPP